MSDPQSCNTVRETVREFELVKQWQGRELKICQSSDILSEEKLCLDLRAILDLFRRGSAAARMQLALIDSI